jgi:cellulose synthase/poly-beta-1,6-N-acetylglucosamine synthase-like glycosyltransferase
MEKLPYHAILFVFTAAGVVLALAGSGYVTILALVGYFSRPKDRSTSVVSPKTRFIILIPAHNEEHGIGPTLDSLRAQNYPQDLQRAIVIADNCMDHTAFICRQAGIECWERTDLASPGKGQALGWALKHLALEPWAAVVFLDADTRVHSDFMIALDRAIQAGATTIQGSYEFELADYSCFALLTFTTKHAENVLWWRPRERFARMGYVGGNGFCVTREILQLVPWTAYSIVEDLEYALELALRGIRVSFVESAKVVSRTTRGIADAAPQRLRWASGTFQVMLKYLPRLLQAAIRRRSLGLLEMGVALVLSSRIFLLYLLVAATTCSLLLGANGIDLLLRIGVIVADSLSLCYAGMVLSQIPNVRGSRFRALITLPAYLCMMVLVHVATAFGMGRNVWFRTTR